MTGALTDLLSAGVVREDTPGSKRLVLAETTQAPDALHLVPVCQEIALSNHMKVTLEYDPDGSRTAILWNEANEPIADGDAPVLAASPAVQPAAGIVTSVDEDGKWRAGSDDPPLPCPWCGTTHLLTVEPLPENGLLVVKCRKCGASGRSRLANRAIEAQALWNDRAAISTPAQASGEIHGEVTDEWAERFCEAVNWSPDGRECKTVEGELRCVSFRDLAKGYILSAIATNPHGAHPPAQASETGGEDSAFKVASDLHAAYEQLIYGLPKYLEAENLTDEENMIREAYITLDVTAHRLAALSAPQAAPGEDAA